jgi:hypothetical protein
MVLLKTVIGPVTPDIRRGWPPRKEATKAAMNWSVRLDRVTWRDPRGVGAGARVRVRTGIGHENGHG